MTNSTNQDKTPTIKDVINKGFSNNLDTFDIQAINKLQFSGKRVMELMTEWSDIQNKQLLERIWELENELEDTKLGVDYWKGKFNELINI